jgi:hypothetical protein
MIYRNNALINNQSDTANFIPQNNAHYVTNNQSLPSFPSADQFGNITPNEQAIGP